MGTEKKLADNLWLAARGLPFDGNFTFSGGSPNHQKMRDTLHSAKTGDWSHFKFRMSVAAEDSLSTYCHFQHLLLAVAYLHGPKEIQAIALDLLAQWHWAYSNAPLLPGARMKPDEFSADGTLKKVVWALLALRGQGNKIRVNPNNRAAWGALAIAKVLPQGVPPLDPRDAKHWPMRLIGWPVPLCYLTDDATEAYFIDGEWKNVGDGPLPMVFRRRGGSWERCQNPHWPPGQTERGNNWNVGSMRGSYDAASRTVTAEAPGSYRTVSPDPLPPLIMSVTFACKPSGWRWDEDGLRDFDDRT